MSDVNDLIDTLAQRFQSLSSKGTPWLSLSDRSKENWRTTARECLRQMRWATILEASLWDSIAKGEEAGSRITLAPDDWSPPVDE